MIVKQPKYNIGDTLYYVLGSSISTFIVKGIDIKIRETHPNSIQTTIDYIDNKQGAGHKEDNVGATFDELVEKLRQNT